MTLWAQNRMSLAEPKWKKAQPVLIERPKRRFNPSQTSMVEVGTSDTYIGRQSGTYPAFHGVGISGIRSEPRVDETIERPITDSCHETLWLLPLG